jgi:hypothetical protein
MNAETTQTYEPSKMPHYIIESDSVNGDKWFAHDSNFTNVVESENVGFGATPQEAIQDLLSK